jgi:iron uptake system EfeUOB component EfeO/EfeM
MKEAALPEVAGNRAQEDFIRAVRSLDESWSTHQLTELVRKDQIEAEFTGISDLVADYRFYYRRIRPIASSLGTFATLGIDQESQIQ